jgi:hypothetical protein
MFRPLLRCLIVMAGLAAAALSTAWAQAAGGGGPAPADESKVVRVLFIMDSLDRLKDVVLQDAKIMEDLLRDGFAKSPERLKIDKLAGAEITPARVMKYYSDMKADPSATLVAIWVGHGATDRTAGAIFGLRGADGKHVDFRRAALRDAMLSKHPRLVVLLSNTCAGYTADVGKRAPVTSRPDWETMRHLFLAPRGVVDINSVSEGELASAAFGGSPSIVAFDETLRQPFAALDLNKDFFLQWQEVLPHYQDKSQQRFSALQKATIVQASKALEDKTLKPEDRAEAEAALKDAQAQPYQTVRVFSLPPQHRLGLRVIDHKEGALVLFAYDHTPAATAGFKAGDIVHKIGGQKITSAKDYTAAVARFKGMVAVEVMRGDTAVTINVMLAPWPHAGTDG